MCVLFCSVYFELSVLGKSHKNNTHTYIYIYISIDVTPDVCVGPAWHTMDLLATVQNIHERNELIALLRTQNATCTKKRPRAEISLPTSATGPKKYLQEAADILGRYMAAETPPPVLEDTASKLLHNVRTQNYCVDCCKPKLIDVFESTSICKQCGVVEVHMDISEFDEYKDRRRSTIAYDRTPLYLKYLQQFSNAGQLPIPQAALDTVQLAYFKNDVLLRHKIRPTPVIQILKDAGLGRHAAFAYRICKLMNQETTAQLTRDIIDALVHRFTLLTSAFRTLATEIETKGKFMNFEFITRQFLYMQNLPELAHHFSLHKTKNVLYRAEQRMEQYCLSLSITYPTMRWQVTFSR